MRALWRRTYVKPDQPGRAIAVAGGLPAVDGIVPLFEAPKHSELRAGLLLPVQAIIKMAPPRRASSCDEVEVHRRRPAQPASLEHERSRIARIGRKGGDRAVGASERAGK